MCVARTMWELAVGMVMAMAVRHLMWAMVLSGQDPEVGALMVVGVRIVGVTVDVVHMDVVVVVVEV